MGHGGVTPHLVCHCCKELPELQRGGLHLEHEGLIDQAVADAAQRLARPGGSSKGHKAWGGCCGHKGLQLLQQLALQALKQFGAASETGDRPVPVPAVCASATAEGRMKHLGLENALLV